MYIWSPVMYGGESGRGGDPGTIDTGPYIYIYIYIYAQKGVSFLRIRQFDYPYESTRFIALIHGLLC